MELNSKKLERTSTLVYYSVSTMLCIFLILLSNKIIEDLDTTTVMPQIETFENKAVMTDLNKKINIVNIEVENLMTKKSTIEKTIATAKENYTNEKQSFDNWLQTRKTLGSPDKDQEVIDRAKNLDQYYKVEQDWRSQLDAGQTEIDSAGQIQLKIQGLIDKERTSAETKYNHSINQYDLRVFGWFGRQGFLFQ